MFACNRQSWHLSELHLLVAARTAPSPTLIRLKLLFNTMADGQDFSATSNDDVQHLTALQSVHLSLRDSGDHSFPEVGHVISKEHHTQDTRLYSCDLSHVHQHLTCLQVWCCGVLPKQRCSVHLTTCSSVLAPHEPFCKPPRFATLQHHTSILSTCPSHSRAAT